MYRNRKQLFIVHCPQNRQQILEMAAGNLADLWRQRLRKIKFQRRQHQPAGSQRTANCSRPEEIKMGDACRYCTCIGEATVYLDLMPQSKQSKQDHHVSAGQPRHSGVQSSLFLFPTTDGKRVFRYWIGSAALPDNLFE
jgi:hypothetical protein